MICWRHRFQGVGQDAKRLERSDTSCWIPNLSDGGNQSCCCRSCVLDASNKYLASVESLSMDLENTCHADSIFETDCPRQCRIVIEVWLRFTNFLQLAICAHGDCLV